MSALANKNASFWKFIWNYAARTLCSSCMIFFMIGLLYVAYRLNFPTQSIFGKYFKEQTGLSPKHYRMLR